MYLQVLVKWVTFETEMRWDEQMRMLDQMQAGAEVACGSH